MAGRILVVDGIARNRRLLEASLASEYFNVLAARTGQEAIELARSQRPDLVLLDAGIGDFDGFEVCRRLKAQPETAHIPVVMLTALSDPGERVRGLEAGADDFLTKPVEDVALFARVRALIRLKRMDDELRLRERTIASFGALQPLVYDEAESLGGARLLLVEDRRDEAVALTAMLSTIAGHVRLVEAVPAALELAASEDFDIVVVSLDLADDKAVALCARLRQSELTRFTPIIVLAEPGEQQRVARALELGVNDYLLRPVDRNEMAARARAQIRRKRYHDRLRHRLMTSLSLSVTDPLTGLYSRRYLHAHLDQMLIRSQDEAMRTALILIDLDHFAALNREHGFAAGDQVLRDCALRLQRNLRGFDLACRYGGETFAILLSDVDGNIAERVAMRLNAVLSGEPARPHGAKSPISLSASIGLGVALAGDDAGKLVARAHDALVAAKARR
ncbi:MAG: PleD family two-component system response regulator [Ferrovibrionaceae bacterium]